MMNNAKTIEVTIERTIPTTPGEAFDAWLNPKIPGNPWNMAEKLLLNPTVDGFFYWAVKGTPHYGRFTAVERPGRIQHTWMSPNTSGLESTATPDGPGAFRPDLQIALTHPCILPAYAAVA